jgi:type III restriction enzyme
VGFKLDYVTADGSISNYIPDFVAKLISGEVWIVETKGREDENDPGKWERRPKSITPPGNERTASRSQN